ncbi:hypothetical protein A2960_01115 [Candidatus Gottesmanbacteria bacterium RIFCSPLOWO2_01_FULL_39_12b]|uniref:Purine nucleoside phosphorylase n=1 Tax=Candidatus Gottesmanbacteria bacterium RIFCSPLOWO2_01_FULL_39_12b TaxID=1798388 RepID=A0A1F6APY4_9BACT|nr:MAG: hypothetical protein A2960_01115 [Candidatus Gottesmanbacteria bacterium RIFCSPLOWO2_01_FULL_39_12b]
MVQSKLLLNFPGVKHYFFDKNDVNKSLKVFNFDSFQTVDQVHGNRVTTINSLPFDSKGYDGMITKRKYLLAIRTADCLPILFYDYKKNIIGAIHAGWRGLSSGIINSLIRILMTKGSQSKHIFGAIGPHIGRCCYDVPRERIKMFGKTIDSDKLVSENRRSSWFLDLGKIAQIQMQQMNIQKRQIDILPFCTSCNKNYYSYRRDGSSTGRMINVIGLN